MFSLIQNFFNKAIQNPIVLQAEPTHYLIPLNVKLVRLGATVCLRNGTPCKVHSINAFDDVCVIFEPEDYPFKTGQETENNLFQFYSNGFFNEHEESDLDLMISLPVPMSRQEIFDKVCQRAMEMEFQTIGYRSVNGPCLIGILIKDEHYNPSLEGFSVRSENVINALLLSGVSNIGEPMEFSFLDRIQDAHDTIKETPENTFGELGSYFKYNLHENLLKISWDFEVEMPADYFY